MIKSSVSESANLEISTEHTVITAFLGRECQSAFIKLAVEGPRELTVPAARVCSD